MWLDSDAIRRYREICVIRAEYYMITELHDHVAAVGFGIDCNESSSDPKTLRQMLLAARPIANNIIKQQ
jgi:hypothetical protein